MRNRRRVESSDESDDDAMESSGSPLRRSSRIRRMSQASNSSNSSDSSDAEQDGQSDQENRNDSNHNHNRNRNRNINQSVEGNDDEDSDVVFDENKNEIEEDEPECSSSSPSDDDNNDNDNDDELQYDAHPNLSTVLPSFVSKLGDKYTKIDEDIQDIALTFLIDTAQSLAEYNFQRQDYEQHTQQLRNTMNKLLNLSKEIQIEQLMYERVSNEIREEKLNENNDNLNGHNPIISGDWNSYLDQERNKVTTEIDSGNVRDDGKAARIRQFVNEKMSEYKQQFDEAIQVDPIEDYDSDDTQGGMARNHNNRNGVEEIQNDEDESDDDDDDIVIDKSSKDINVGSLKCPLTMKIFERPYKSKQCGHCFERDAILGYIEDKNKSGEPAQCPLPGCINILTKDQLTRDIKIEKLIKAQSKKQQDEDSDDEDVAFDLTVQTP